MAKNCKTEKMDWTDLTTAERHAIAIANLNSVNNGNTPPFPFLHVLFDELAGELKGIIAEREQSALAVSDEIHAITKVLTNVVPTLSKDEIAALNQDDLKRYLLQVISLRFLVDVLNLLGHNINTVKPERLN